MRNRTRQHRRYAPWPTPMPKPFRSGFVALLGRPNVGKSTLMNRIIGHKIAITSRRPQTTRQRVLGIKTGPDSQIVFVDTPGIHRDRRRAINVVMNRTARATVEDVDVIVVMIDVGGWRPEDRLALDAAGSRSIPVILVINKIDQLKSKTQLLPLIEASKGMAHFAEIVPVSAQTGSNIDRLEEVIVGYLPEAPAGFPADQITDRSERFLASEFIREQLFRGLGQELPYVSAVQIEEMARKDGLIRIQATIWVESDGQKAIVIGKGGERLKAIGKQARLAMEKEFASKVFLELWVKVRKGWSDDANLLRSLGYTEDG